MSSQLQAFGSWRIILLNSDDLGDDGDVLTRVGENAAAFRPGGGGGAAWGGITGTLSAQTDLQAALNAVTPILHQATVELTDAQIKALPTTPVQIVAAPGANKALVLIRATLIASGPTAYTNIDAGVYIQFINSESYGFNSPPITNIVGDVTALLTGAGADMFADIIPTAQTDAVWGAPTAQASSLSSITNKAILLQAFENGDPSVDFTGGNAANTLRVSVTYCVLNVLTGQYE